jgi:hypothetical protein
MEIGYGSGRTGWQSRGSIGSIEEMKTADDAAALLQVLTGPYIDSYRHYGLSSSY